MKNGKIYSLMHLLGGDKPIGQKTLAEYLGASQVSVSRWATGKARPTGVHDTLVAYSNNIGEFLPDLVRAVAQNDPGENGLARLTALVGRERAMAMVGRHIEGSAVARLASLLEVTAVLAPPLVDARPGAVAAPTRALTLREEAEQAVREYLALEARYKAKTY